MGIYIIEYNSKTDELVRQIRIDGYFNEKQVIQIMGIEDEKIYNAYDLNREESSYFAQLGIDFDFNNMEYFIQSFSDD